MKTSTHFTTLIRRSLTYSKRKIFLSFAIFLFACVNSYAQNSADLIFNPSTVTVTNTQNFTINVRVHFISGTLDAAAIFFNFDKTKLEVASATNAPSSSILPTVSLALESPATMNANGQVKYVAGTSSNFPAADFDVISVTFKALQVGVTPLTFRRPPITAPNANLTRSGSSILNSVTNASITVQNNCTLPTATIEAASSSSAICNGQPVGLRLSAATGASPYSLIINGVTYSNVTVGSTFAAVPLPSYSIWPSSASPAQNGYDGQAIEVGTKFRSTASGFIKGIRLYIGTGNTGTSYTCKLWNPAGAGTLLASMAFTPVSSGWQEVLFTVPVSIAANTTYIASYFSASGKYVNTDYYFSTSGVTNGPLTAPQDGGISGSNGVFRLGSGGGIPTSSFASANYWADVVFTANNNAFNLTSVTNATGCTNAGSLQTLTVISAECSGTLPITLLNLSATATGKKVTLNWATSSEINNKGFDVLRSIDGVNWTTIGYVAGAGNSSSVKNYTYPDDNLASRKYYYRLKQIDVDDRFKYSMVVSAVVGSKADYALGQNYPNPVSNETTIQFTLARAEQVNISLFDVSGRAVKTLVNASKEAGTHAISFNIGTLNRGVYYYRIQAGDFTDVKKLTIQ